MVVMLFFLSNFTLKKRRLTLKPQEKANNHIANYVTAKQIITIFRLKFLVEFYYINKNYYGLYTRSTTNVLCSKGC